MSEGLVSGISEGRAVTPHTSTTSRLNKEGVSLQLNVTWGQE